MADLDEKLRPVASPQWTTQPDQAQQSGVSTLTPWGWVSPDAMSNLWRLLTSDNGQPLPDFAKTAGAPMDAIASALHQIGVPIPGGPAPFDPGVWRPAASVPLGSQNIRGLLDNLSSFDPPSLDALLRAARRPSLL
jgi:hypothetical protein